MPKQDGKPTRGELSEVNRAQYRDEQEQRREAGAIAKCLKQAMQHTGQEARMPDVAYASWQGGMERLADAFPDLIARHVALAQEDSSAGGRAREFLISFYTRMRPEQAKPSTPADRLELAGVQAMLETRVAVVVDERAELPPPKPAESSAPEADSEREIINVGDVGAPRLQMR